MMAAEKPSQGEISLIELTSSEDEEGHTMLHNNRRRVRVLPSTDVVNKCYQGGTSTSNAISVEHYCELRDFHLATMTSDRSKQEPPFIDLSGDDFNDDVQVLPHEPPSVMRRRNKRNCNSIIEIGESSNSKEEPAARAVLMCEICVEPTPYKDMFFIMGCTHSCCSKCCVRYVASRLQDNIAQIHCPLAASSGCQGLLEPHHCRSILPPEVFDRWGSALCEAVILASEKFYCPFKDCSALLIMDDNDNAAMITQSECPNCRRLFCARCKVSWHSGILCEEFQKLNKDEREKEDLMLMQLAKNNKWIRCPRCRFYVEKSEGCLFMRCRCGHTFCYNCGAPLVNHYCNNCKH